MSLFNSRVHSCSSSSLSIALTRVLRLSIFCLFFLSAVSVRADLKPSQVRKPITRMPGFELTNGAVRVRSITSSTGGAVDALAEIRTVFRLEQNQQGVWRVAQIRTAPDRWEDIELIARALNGPNSQTTSGQCTVPDPPVKGSSGIQPTVKRARCVLGSLLGIEVPSDAIRIQEVSPLVIPTGTETSAVVVAWVRVEARLVNGEKGWQVTELRTGKSDWAKVATVIATVDKLKRERVRTELGLVAGALKAFRQARGSYVVSDSHAVAIDYLNPAYLSRIIRVDPWHRPYKYLGENSRFTLRSDGPDGKENTPDDILVSEAPQR